MPDDKRKPTAPSHNFLWFLAKMWPLIPLAYLGTFLFYLFVDYVFPIGWPAEILGSSAFFWFIGAGFSSLRRSSPEPILQGYAMAALCFFFFCIGQAGG
jgi:hypothetical protein